MYLVFYPCKILWSHFTLINTLNSISITPSGIQLRVLHSVVRSGRLRIHRRPESIPRRVRAGRQRSHVIVSISVSYCINYIGSSFWPLSLSNCPKQKCPSIKWRARIPFIKGYIAQRDFLLNAHVSEFFKHGWLNVKVTFYAVQCVWHSLYYCYQYI